VIRALLRPIGELTSGEWSEVLEFGSRFFEGAFEASLRTKHELVMLRDGAGTLVGMGAVEMFEIDGATIIHVGNTAFADETRGQSHVQRLGFRYFLRAKARHPLRPVYLAYTTFSWRTYLMLTRNFARSWPRRELALPEREGVLYRKIGARLLGERFEPETGLVRNLDRRLRADIAAIPEKLANDADAQFFVARNPGYASGDAVLCLAPLDARNWWSVARRASRRSSRSR
jgi:hypothetical protein